MRRTELAIAAAAAATSLAVSIPRAFAYPFWEDEVGSARLFVARGPASVLRGTAADQVTPPGYFLFGWFFHQVGMVAVWERAFSVLAAAVLCAAVVLYARRLLPLVSAALVGLIVALAWQSERHGWELRTYSLFALASFLVVYLVELTAEDPTPRRRATLAFLVAVGALAHYFFVFTVAAGVVWLFVSPTVRHRKPALVSITVGLVPLLLWTPGFIKQYQHKRFATLGPFSVRRIVDLYGDLLERSLPRGIGGLLLALAILALVLLGVARLWRDPGRGRLCALAAVVPLVITAVLWLSGPHLFAPRNLIGILPFAGISIAASLAVQRRTVGYFATAAAAGLIAFGFVRANGRITPDYDRVAAALVAEGWHQGDPILLFGSPYAYLHPLDWYLPGSERLEIAVPTPSSCETLFIVAVGGQARALTAPLGPHVRNVRSVVIGSFPWRADAWQEVRKHRGYVLGTRRSPCVRPATA